MKKLWVCGLAAAGLVFGGCMREENTDAYGGGGHEGVRGAQEQQVGNQPDDANRPPSDAREMERNDGSGRQGTFGQHSETPAGTGGAGEQDQDEAAQEPERPNAGEGGVVPQ